MAPFPEIPAGPTEPADPLETTAQFEGDPTTLIQEIQRAKDQDPCLIIIRGKPQGQRHFLTRDEMIIGRDPSAEVCIADEAASRKHAKVTTKGESVLLTDLGSANGTFLNETRLRPSDPVRLVKEDMIRIGNSIFKFLPAGELEIIFYGNLGAAAHTDALTRVYNRGYLLEALDAEFKRATALHTDLSLIFLDLDHFKSVNDTFGHEAGDCVLKEIAEFIHGQLLRPRDIFARYGGEEFVILLPGETVKHTATLAERIRAAVEAHAFVYEGRRIPVTCSMGVATLLPEIESPSTLLKAADKAGYASKQNGRNRVTIASSS